MAKPRCATCSGIVEGRAVFALGRGYHPTCFWPKGVPQFWNAPGVAEPAGNTNTTKPTESDK